MACEDALSQRRDAEPVLTSDGVPPTSPASTEHLKEGHAARAWSTGSHAKGKGAPQLRRRSRPILPTMVAVPGGTFLMGDQREFGLSEARPVHPVVVRPFLLATTEVTVQEFRAFVDSTGYATSVERNFAVEGCYAHDASSGSWYRRNGVSWRSPGFVQTENDPVVCVSWLDAKAYVSWLNAETRRRFRLPTEAEWEYAARAGSDAPYPWGSEPSAGCRFANGADETPWPSGSRSWSSKLPCSDHYFNTSPVALRSANPYGLFDMIGNVWEWTADCWHNSFQGAPRTQEAWVDDDCEVRVFRGGSWYDGPPVLGAIARYGHPQDFANSTRGFRIAE